MDCAVTKFDLDSGKLIKIPVSATVATSCKVSREFIALETLIEVVKVFKSVLVCLFNTDWLSI